MFGFVSQILKNTGLMAGDEPLDPNVALHPSIKATFLMAFTFRSGSNMFCDCLGAVGCGKPTEYFQVPLGTQNKWFYDRVGATTSDFKKFLPRMTRRFSQNNIFGAKLAWSHRNAVAQRLARDFPQTPTFDTAFNHPVWLQMVRRDKVAQAISAWRAARSGAWYQVKGDTQKPPADPYPDYHFAELYGALSHIHVCEFLWAQWFATSGIKPLVFVYEDFLAEPKKHLFQALDAIQKKAGTNIWQSAETLSFKFKSSVQRDEHSEKIRRQFEHDLENLDINGELVTPFVAPFECRDVHFDADNIHTRAHPADTTLTIEPALNAASAP